MRAFRVLWVVGSLLVSFPLFAQQSFLKPVVRAIASSATEYAAKRAELPFEKAVRVSGQAHVVANQQIGQEILRGEPNSVIGTQAHLHFNQVADRVGFLGSTLSRTIAEHVLKPTEVPPAHFPGFYTDFAQAWRAFNRRTQSKGGCLEVLLEAAYGIETQFEGSFVSTFNEVMKAAEIPVENPVSAGQALEQARTRGRELKSGFFVIRVAGNSQRPKDTLLLDLEQVNFITLNRSKARAWATAVHQRTLQEDPLILKKFPYLESWKTDPSNIDRRDTQGVILRVSSAQKMGVPEEIGVSITGNSWTYYHLDPARAYTPKEALKAAQIWIAWNKGYYIMTEESGGILFAAEKGKPLFSTVEEVDAYVSAQTTR